MTDSEPIDLWLKAAGRWSQFLKPSLFVAPPSEVKPVAPPDVATPWLPTGGDTAVIVELPPEESVAIGVALGKLGWCVVPLFNTTHGERELIPTWPMVRALYSATRSLPEAPTGPPVFLSSSERAALRSANDGEYDNGWYLFASDFPSAELFKSRGITRILVVTHSDLARDLQDALAGYGELELQKVKPSFATAEPIQLHRGRVIRALAGFGRALSRNSDGSFGRKITHG